MDDLLAEFLAETLENTAEVRGRAVAGEADEIDIAADVFRMTATIAATARFLDISRLKDVAVAAEALAVGARDGRLKVGPEVNRLLLAAVGRIEEIATEMTTGNEVAAASDEELVYSLENAAGIDLGCLQINALDSSLRPNLGSHSQTESPRRLRLIEGGLGESVRDETLPDRR